MNDSKKPVSTEDLRKALERKAMTLEDIITFVNNELNEWHRRRVLKEKWILKVDVEDLFSVFQADYDKQVHVPHKQLTELLEQMPNPREEKYFTYDHQFRRFEFVPELLTWKEKLKELFEVQK